MGLMHHVIMRPAVTMTTVLVSPRGGRGRLPIVILLLLHLGPVGTRDGLITLTQPLLLLLLLLTGSSLSLRHFVLRVLGRLFQLRQSLICLEDKRDHHTYVRHGLHIQCVCVCMVSVGEIIISVYYNKTDHELACVIVTILYLY